MRLTQCVRATIRHYTGGSFPAVLSAKEVSHEEPDLSTMIENVAYGPSYSCIICRFGSTAARRRGNKS